MILSFWLLIGVIAGELDTTVNSDTFFAWEQQPFLAQGQTTLTSRIRLNLNYELNPHWNFQAAYELDHYYHQGIQSPQNSVWLRAEDIDLVLDNGNPQLLLQQLDRFNLNWEQGRWRFKLGRQAVGHGNGRFFNPSDIFAPLSPYTLNSQYKSGVDGARLIRAMGDQTELEAMVLLPQSGEAVYLMRLVTRIQNLDISILAGQTYGETTLAWDLATSWMGAAVYTEGVWRKGENRKDPLRMSMGFQRRFGSLTDVTIESHYHNLSKENPLAFLLQPEVRHGELFLLNQNHVALSVSRQITPMMVLSASVMAETHDHSAWQQIGLGWDASQRATVTLGYLATQGSNTSEYGFRSNAAYAELRLTFP